jgi:tetratricopeptide (TPR) repeat protein/2-polyprenyl-3-methyl-5-hydroxy-6-metoxy-1,4-benzoquinol methylase
MRRPSRGDGLASAKVAPDSRTLNGAKSETILKEQRMRDMESARTNQMTVEIADSPLIESRNRAFALIDEGNGLEELGRIPEAMALYDAALQADPQCARAHLNRGNILANAQFQEARGAYQLAIACDAHYAAAHFNLGNLNYRAGEFELALRNQQAAIDIRPDFADAFVAMANALDSLGRTAEAIENYERALEINPGYAEVHFNLGVLAATQGRHEDAKNSLRRAIDIRPDFASAHYRLGRAMHALGRSDEALESLQQAVRIAPTMHAAHYGMAVIMQSLHPNPRLDEAASSLRRAADILPDSAQGHHALGLVLSRLEQLDAAEASLRRALSIEPTSAEILYDLAMTLLSLGRSPEALPLIVRALERAPTWTTKLAFVSCVARTRFAINDPQVRTALTTAIIEPWGMLNELCQPALSLVMLDNRIASCVRLANGSWPARLPKSTLFGADGLVALAADTMLRALLETVPVSTIEFQRFLTCARHALLETASNKQAPRSSDVAALQFYAALSRQCFVNEYIFDCDDWEKDTAAACRAELLALLEANAVVPPLLLLAVAAYFPLNTLRDASRLLAANEPGPIDEVLRQQIREPLEEQALRAGVECLTSITGGVSEKVRDQYEQNPYPRWMKLPMCHQALFNDELRRALPFAPFVPMPDDSAPEVLVAGCGTGCHSILIARRFRGARVLAIDLSLSSICYAKRKTQELGITNIEYAQADILKLGDIARTFDIVESRGVLHHLADPFLGWRTLLSRLRPGGFMGLGLYSEIARRHVVKARELIAARGYAGTLDGIRRFREDLTAKDLGVELQWLSGLSDFYSTSDCRDLLFHVQEHRLTLGQIESFLTELGLRFIGFELDPGALHQYRASFTDDPSGTNLRNWARFEAENPDTFAGMYHFWIQKPISH